jgi:UDP-glucose 4-epimerase
MNILITGGSGYIGSYLTKTLLAQGHQVDIIARSENEFIRNYSDKIGVYYTDITLPFDFKVKEIQYDIFIHLGAANDIDSADPSYAINASVLGTRYALDFCAKNNIKKAIYYSTFQVYGAVEGDMSENSILQPTNDYGITHQFAEQYFEMYQRTKGIDYIVIRPTNIFGSPMYRSTDRWSLVPSCFCKEAFEKGEINLMSSGLQKRDFIDVNDLAAASALYCANFDSYKNRTINVSSGVNYTIVEIARLVSQQYKNQFNKDCVINIHSEMPLSENVFYLCREEISKINHDFGGKEKMTNEITTIFNILR